MFVKRLRCFYLISTKDIETLQQSPLLEQGNNSNIDVSTLLSFLIGKLRNETSVYHKTFKYCLGYYQDFQSIYHNWNSLSKMCKVRKQLILAKTILVEMPKFVTVGYMNTCVDFW